MVKEELSSLWHNKLLVVVLCAIILIPSIYAGFFLSSMWDPYGDLNYLPVAVVNHDESVTYNGKELAVGQQLADSLKENDAMAFNVVDENVAREGLENGTYYMVVTIPKEFSHNATTLMETDPTKLCLEFATNPGRNYISMKLGESAVKEIKANITEEIIRTYAENVFDSLTEVEDGFGEAVDGTQEMLDGQVKLIDGNETITENLEKVTDGADTLSNGAKDLKDGITTYTDGVGQVDDGVTKLSNGIATLDSGVSAGIDQLANGAGTLENGVKQYTKGVKDAADGADKLKANNKTINKGATDLSNGAKTLSDSLKTYTDGVKTAKQGADTLAQNNEKLNSGASALAQGAEDLDKSLSAYTQGIDTASSGAKTLAANNTGLKDGAKKISDGATDLKTGSSQILGGLNQMSSTIAGSMTAENQAKMDAAIGGLNQLNAGINQLDAQVNAGGTGLVDMMKTLSGSAGQIQTATQGAKNGIDAVYGGLSQIMAAIDNGQITTAEEVKALMTANQILPSLKIGNPQAPGIYEAVDGANSGLLQMKAGMDAGLATDGSGSVVNLSQGISQLKAGATQVLEPSASALGDLKNGLLNAKSALDSQLIPGMTQLDAGLSTLAEGSTALQTGLATYTAGVDSLNAGLATLEGYNNQISAGTKSLSSGAKTLAGGITTYTEGVGTLQNGLGTLNGYNAAINTGASDLSQGAKTLKTGLNSYTDGVKKLDNGLQTLKANNQKLNSGCSELSGGTGKLKTGISDGIGQLQSGAKQLKEGTSQLSGNSEKLKDGAGKIADGANTLADGSKQLTDGSKELGDGLAELNDGTVTLHDALADGKEEIAQNHASEESLDMFAAPVETKEEMITSVENNGHAMAAYMLSVGLWVGCLAFCLMYPLVEYRGKLKNGLAWWASKAVIAGPVALIMAFVVMVVLTIALGFHPVSWSKTLGVAMVTAISFMTIMYFCNVLMGKVGSFLMLIFMVLQLTGSAGTYPIEVSGGLAQALHVFMPFTYSVDAFRSAISGGAPVNHEIAVLLGIAAFFTAATILLFQIRGKLLSSGKKMIYDWIEEKGLA